MKLTIKANEKITVATIKEFSRAGEDVGTKTNTIEGDIYAIEFDFLPSYLWSDLEFWLEDENGECCDHIALNVTKRQKMQTHK